MKQLSLLLALMFIAVPVQGQGLRTPLRPTVDTAGMTATDSLHLRARRTAAKGLFNSCQFQAFQTCAAGEIEARLTSDGTAYGVLITRIYDGKGVFLWRLGRGGVRRVGGGKGKGVTATPPIAPSDSLIARGTGTH